MKRETNVLLALALAGLALVGGVFGMRLQLEEAWNEWNALGQKRADISERLNDLAGRRAQLLEALEEAEAEVKAPAAPEWENLQAQAQDVLQKNNVELLPARSGEASSLDGQRGTDRLALAFQGEYYDVMQVLADWRALPLKLAALTIQRIEALPFPDESGRVEAQAILEPLQ